MDYSGQQFGNYQLIKFLGGGAFADVYLGEHIYLKSLAAIKILRTSLTNEAKESFLSEARTLMSLSHPHIIRMLDFGIQGTLPFLVMDYAPHGTLRQRHPKGKPLPLPIIVRSIQQLADALFYAHQQKLIHRDIKPENMLVGKRDEILLSDFGIAVVAQSTRYQGSHDIAGTAAYMAPEQIQSHPCAASDQYALGIVVYEWLSGDCPFHGSFFEIAAQHAFAPPPSLQGKNPAISSFVEQVVMKTLEKDPSQRFPDVKAFAFALEQASQGTVLHLGNGASLPAGESSRPTFISGQPPFAIAGKLPFEPTQLAGPLVQLATRHVRQEKPHRSKYLFQVILLSLLVGILLLTAGIAFSPLLTIIRGGSLSTSPPSSFKPVGAAPTQSSHNTLPAPTTPPPTSATLSPTALPSPTPTSPPSTPIPTANPYVQLKAFYSGIAQGSLNATMTFTLKSQDQQGQVIMEILFQHVDNPQKFAHYLCQGAVTTTRNLTLHCVQEEVRSYLMDIQGSIYADGHMEGTDIATNIHDSTYYYQYAWSAS
ncbi:MAG: serine/threonine protein kinase [Chloroflexota bacterium]|nr:serine/threonine protein kinase [Chloroflexota bacterium]